MLLRSIHRLSIQCFVLLLFAGFASTMPNTAEATSALNGFNLEEDAQGTVRIQLDTPTPIAVEEQRQQGVYKLILKNTVISDKMKRDGLPVVMDTQGKYIARATQLPNNQVSITIPNGVDLTHQVQVIGGATTATKPTQSNTTVENAPPPSTPYLQTEATTTATKTRRRVAHKTVSHYRATTAHRGVVPLVQTLTYKRLKPAHSPLLATTPVKQSAGYPNHVDTVAVENSSVPVTVTVSGMEHSSGTASSTPVGSMMFAQATEIAQPTISEKLPVPLVFDTDWLAKRFNTADSAPLAPESSFPWMPLLTIGVGISVAVGLGVWAKKASLPQQWLAKRTPPLEPLNVTAPPTTVLPEPAAFSSAKTVVEPLPELAQPSVAVLAEESLTPSPEAVIQASQNILDSLFVNSLKQQASLPHNNTQPATEISSNTLPTQPELTAPAVVGTVQPASIHSAQQPSILKPTVAPQAKPAMAQTGAGLQATLVQAIKKSETTTVRTIKAPAMLIATVTPRKQDFKAITQRLGNKKFLGVY